MDVFELIKRADQAPSRFIEEGRVDSTQYVFRSSFPVIARWSSAFGTIVGVILDFIAWTQKASAPVGFATAISLGMGAVYAVAVVCFPVYVRPDGIRCYNFYGSYHTLPWASVARLRVVNLLGLRYLVASSPSGRPELWIPLWLSDMPGFARAVRGFAGEQHPLTEALAGFDPTWTSPRSSMHSMTT